jgi:hypothetical protein
VGRKKKIGKDGKLAGYALENETNHSHPTAAPKPIDTHLLLLPAHTHDAAEKQNGYGVAKVSRQMTPSIRRRHGRILEAGPM